MLERCAYFGIGVFVTVAFWFLFRGPAVEQLGTSNDQLGSGRQELQQAQLVAAEKDEIIEDERAQVEYWKDQAKEIHKLRGEHLQFVRLQEDFQRIQSQNQFLEQKVNELEHYHGLSNELHARIFKLDPKLFLQGMTASLGMEQPSRIQKKGELQLLVRNFFAAAGVDLTPEEPDGKAFYYDDLSGVLFVRVTETDLEVIEKTCKALEH